MSGVYSCMNLRPDYMFEETLGKCDKKRAAGMEEPHLPKSDEMAECSSQPHQPLVCDTFKNCEGPSHVVFMDGKGVVMLGKVMSYEQESEAASAYSADGGASACIQCRRQGEKPQVTPPTSRCCFSPSPSIPGVNLLPQRQKIDATNTFCLLE